MNIVQVVDSDDSCQYRSWVKNELAALTEKYVNVNSLAHLVGVH